MKRLSMKKIREVLRLRATLSLSAEKIAYATSIGETTVRRYLFLANKVGISWPLPEGMDDDQLEKLLYPSIKTVKASDPPFPDFEYIYKELKRKGVTLTRLWDEYSQGQNHYSYSQFCLLYKRWKSFQDPSMIQIHKAGEKTFIDYAGLSIPIYDSRHGEVFCNAQIFVAVLGASGYIFCEATESQGTKDWVGSHKRMGEYFEGVTTCWVPDNLKTAVTRADRYEPDINGTYFELSQHYGSHVLPARVRKPQDKAKVEGAVYFIETQILAALRNHRFFSIEELNKAIEPMLYRLNREPFQKMPGSSRYSLYLEVDKPALQSLPERAYDIFHWGKMTVDSSYHVIIEDIPYSVPYRFIKKTVEFKHNEKTVEFIFKSKQIAFHTKGKEKHVPVTNPSHCPPRHQHQARCTEEEIRKQAQEIGVPALEWVDKVLQNPSLHINQRINTALGVVRLNKSYPNERLNLACARGLFYENFKAKGIKDMLKRNLDQVPLPKQIISTPLPQNHGNIRGAAYYI